jgi:hypothetical protein
VLHHLAAILFFAGPLFHIALWMTLDPAVLQASFGAWCVFHPERTDITRRLRRGVKCAGVLLVLVAIAF